MGIFKKAVAVIVTAAVLTGAAYGGIYYSRSLNQKTVTVVSVASLKDEYYAAESELEGTITTNVSQKVTLGDDVIIQDIYVNKGDEVKKGDLMMTLDTTLVSMELEIAKLKQQLQEQQLSQAEARLVSLQNGGPIEETDANSGTADNIDATSTDSSSSDETIMSEMSRINGIVSDSMYTAAAFTLYAAEIISDALGDGEVLSSGDELSSGDSQAPQESGLNSGDVVNGTTEDQLDDGSGETGDSEIINPAPTPTPVVIDPDTEDELTDGEQKFYMELDYNSVPYTGTGTEEDPFVFLVSSYKGYVTAKGSFFNKMAGYSEDGTTRLYDSGYWYLLEFHEDDTVADPSDRTASSTGYYFVNGSLLENPVNPFVETELTLEGALQYTIEDEEEEDDTGDIDYGGGSGGDSSTQSSITREEAIRIQQMKIESLELDIRTSEINIGKLERKVAQTEITALLDGIVSYVGDGATGSSEEDSFITVKSKDGYFLKGTVSELMLDDMKEGTILDCTSYISGSFQAKVLEVSEYPTDASDGYGYMGDSNPNASYYTYTAEIEDQSLSFSDSDWITVSLGSTSDNSDSIVISRSFVRSENGNYYVLKDENGVLVKQYVNVKSTVYSGYSYMIDGGLSDDDRIAFPYGSLAVEGTKTTEGTLDDLYEE